MKRAERAAFESKAHLGFINCSHWEGRASSTCGTVGAGASFPNTSQKKGREERGSPLIHRRTKIVVAPK